MRVFVPAVLSVFCVGCASSPAPASAERDPLEFGAACVASAKWIAENAEDEAVEGAQELQVVWEDVLSIHPVGPEAIKARIDYSYNLTSAVPVSAQILFPKCAEDTIIEQRRIQVQELADVAYEGSAEYAAKCMAAATLITPIAELADPATLEIYEAVEKYWQDELGTRSADASKAADYGSNAIEAMGVELGEPGEPAFRKAQTILQSCEAST